MMPESPQSIPPSKYRGPKTGDEDKRHHDQQDYK